MMRSKQIAISLCLVIWGVNSALAQTAPDSETRLPSFLKNLEFTDEGVSTEEVGVRFTVEKVNHVIGGVSADPHWPISISSETKSGIRF